MFRDVAPCSFVDIKVSEEPVVNKYCSECGSNWVLRSIGVYKTKRCNFLETSDINRRFAAMRTSGFKRKERVQRDKFCWYFLWKVGWDMSVGTETRYGLDGPGIESQRGARFSAPV